MEFKEVVEKRRTTRQFKNEPVGREAIERIIKAGLAAPSFDHCRKWNFVIIDEPVPRTHMDTAEMWCVIENIFLAAANEGLSCAMRIPTEGQLEKILAAVGCAEDFILPCMIGIGHPADNAEYPTQTYPSLADCVHWNKW